MFSAKKKLLFLSLFLLIAAVSEAQLVNLSRSLAYENLGGNILDTFNAANRVNINCPMHPLQLDVNTAVTVGLMANDLLTIAMKYAFDKNTTGEISISLAETINKANRFFGCQTTAGANLKMFWQQERALEQN